jgi:hypothetical protein
MKKTITLCDCCEEEIEDSEIVTCESCGAEIGETCCAEEVSLLGDEISQNQKTLCSDCFDSSAYDKAFNKYIKEPDVKKRIKELEDGFLESLRKTKFADKI